MRQVFLLIALLFTGFMCGKEYQDEQSADVSGSVTVSNGGQGGKSPVAESLEVTRAQFQRTAAECRRVVIERNGSPEVVKPSNPTHDILSKTHLPEE